MTDLRTAAQQALEALELHAKQYPHMQKGYTADAITTLRSALVEPEQDRALQWGAAPVRIELGSSPNGWREAFLPLGKNNTLRLLAETEALPLVENALRAALAQQAEPVAVDAAYQRWLEDTHAPALRRMDSRAAFSAGWQAALAQQAEPDHETRAELAEQQVVQLAEERDHYRNLWRKARQAEPVAWADKISFENAMKTGKGHDVWPKAGDYETRTGRALIGLYTAPPQRPPLTDEEFDALCKANSFGAVARNQFPLIPRAMLKALVDAAIERKVRGEEK